MIPIGERSSSKKISWDVIADVSNMNGLGAKVPCMKPPLYPPFQGMLD
jgi:hypothetical protein